MANEALARRMKQTHKEYQRLRPEYDFLRSSYMGGSSYLAKNLFRHAPREQEQDFKRRLERAVYPNYVRPVIRTYRDHVFRHEDGITRPEDDPRYVEWLTDVDRRGTEANRFWGGVLARQLLYGWTAILVDSPQLRPEVTSLADQQAFGDLPYLVHVSPRQIVDWHLDENGAFEWVRIEERVTHAPTPLDEVKSEARWRIWTRDSWMIVTEKGVVTEGGEHDLGVVPLVVTRFENPEEDDHTNELAGTSFMPDFARINRMIANKTSEADSFLSKNMLQILTVAVNYMAQMGADGDQQQSLKDGSIIEWPSEGAPPQFIAPDVSGAAQTFEHIQMLRWELFRLATQKDIRAEATMSAESGVAKMVDFEEQNAVLASLADSMEVAEQSATELWFQWQGQETKAAEEIDYPDNFNLRALEGDMAVAVQVQGLYATTSPTFYGNYLLDLTRRIGEDLDAETRAIVEAELTDNLQNQAQEMSDLGRAGREAETPFDTDDDEDDEGERV
tara:strand:+ start:5576 stop:7084 length:1509 start_codon:yes stop_codon:yes gene_type:complete